MQVAQVEVLPQSGGSDEQLAEAKGLGEDILSAITMQSLLCLLRSTNVRKAGAQEQKWLRELLESYAVEGSRLNFVLKHLEEADLLLGTSVAAAYAVRHPAAVVGVEEVVPQHAGVSEQGEGPVEPAGVEGVPAVVPKAEPKCTSRKRRTRAEIVADKAKKEEAAAAKAAEPKSSGRKRVRIVGAAATPAAAGETDEDMASAGAPAAAGAAEDEMDDAPIQEEREADPADAHACA